MTIETSALASDEARSGALLLASAGVPLRLERGTEAPPSADERWFAEHFVARSGDDPRERELRSTELRRAARERLRPGRPTPEVAVLLASKRPTLLGAALEQIRAQRMVQAQVVVGLHGSLWDEAELPPGLDESCVFRFDDGAPLGVVLAGLTAAVRSPLITKWDDDDWYGVDHVADLVDAYEYSGADVVGKAAEFVRLESSDVTIRRFAFGAESFSWTLAGGAMLTSASWLDQVGGWPPVASGVDRALLDAGRLAGSVAYRTHGFQYVLRRSATGGHTWRAPDTHFLEAAVEQRPGLDLEFAGIAPVGAGHSSAS